jgi:N-acetylglucosamine kinase-like BadF-type ATPase
VTWYAGVDGGQTSTVAAIGDDRGEVARGVGPPADLVGRPREPARQARAIGEALAAACIAAGIAPETRFAGLVAGITGFDAGESAAIDLGAHADRVSVVHDATIAHAAAFAGAAGIVAIAGTGSVAVGNASAGDALVRAGGWGYFFGDEGSAMWIAREALRSAMARADAGEPSELAERACAFFNGPASAGAGGIVGPSPHGFQRTLSLRAIQHAFAHGDITRPALAAFAAEVFESAASGDADAGAVRDAACRELARLVATVDRRLAPPTTKRLVSYAGGLWNDAAFLAGFRAALAASVPHSELTAPRLDPAAGALVLARRLAASEAVR